jgi:hypothetical protein
VTWIVVAVLLVFALALLLAPLPIELSAQGRGEPGGDWALAGGVACGPLAGAAVAARGVEPALRVLLFGRRVLSRSLAGEREAEPSGATLAERWQRLSRWIDPGELARFLLRERRRVRIVRLQVDLSYSFADVTLTGRMLGALHALGALLPPAVTLRHEVCWDAVDRGRIVLSGRLKLWPGLVFLDTLLFLARHLRLTRPKPAAPGATA